MQTIILAAGLGGLGDAAEGLPHALIEVGGRPLIHYSLAFARAAGADHRIVVGGCCHAQLARRIESRDPDAVVVENTDFRTGNLISFLAGRARLEPGGFLLMRADRIYTPALASQVAHAAGTAQEVTVFCDRGRELGPDDVKVRLDASGRVAELGKLLDAWDLGYVGFTYVPATRVASHGDAARRALDRVGEQARVESVLVELALGGAPPVVADVGDHLWIEVERADQREAAEAMVWRENWWT
jgi:choline kinase